MVRLPAEFEKRMREMLSEEEFCAYCRSLSEPARSGMRVNRLKCSTEDFRELFDFSLTPVPWIDNGFFYEENAVPGKNPYYYGGLYYLQEPSAMTPANLLPVSPGDKVLDLCAAPGGKSTELAAKLNGTGLLVANDISNSRAKALLKNLEVFGVRNAVCLSEDTEVLSRRFPAFFDKILVDAPCSGEGMFRKQPAIMKNWEQYGTGYYAKLQREILPRAVHMLAPGGLLLYSTCTFSPEEDEEMVSFVLKNYPEMELLPAVPSSERERYRSLGFRFGKPEWMKEPDSRVVNTVRLFPHCLEGEGHFIALFRKNGREAELTAPFRDFEREDRLPKELTEFLKLCHFPIDLSRIHRRQDSFYLIPEGTPDISGLRTLRSGLLLGEFHKKRFEPSQALASSMRPGEYEYTFSLPPGDERILRYLKCESIELPDSLPDGYVLIMAGSVSLGFVKKKGENIRNKFLPGWRYL